MTLNLFHTEAVLWGMCFFTGHREQFPQIRSGTIPALCVRSKPPTLACPETVEDMSYFSTLSRLSSYSHLLITHTVTCPQMDVLLGRATHPCPLFQENSVCFAPLTEEFQSGETSLWVSPFTHGTPCLQFSQPKVLFKWLWRLFYIL